MCVFSVTHLSFFFLLSHLHVTLALAHEFADHIVDHHLSNHEGPGTPPGPRAPAHGEIELLASPSENLHHAFSAHGCFLGGGMYPTRSMMCRHGADNSNVGIFTLRRLPAGVPGAGRWAIHSYRPFGIRPGPVTYAATFTARIGQPQQIMANALKQTIVFSHYEPSISLFRV